MNKSWPFGFYFLIFSSVAFIGPYIVLYYQSLGFTGAQIGLLTGVTPLISLLGAPFWTGLADATRKHRLIMSMALTAGLAAMLVFPLLTAFLPIILLAGLYNMFFSPVTALADSATMAMLGPDKSMYGRIRLGGTFGFGLSAPLAGMLVQTYGLRAAFWGCAALMFLSLLVSQKFVYSKLRDGAFSLKNMGVLLTNPRWVYFLLLAFAGGFGIASSHYYFFPYMKELGASETVAGLALSIGTISEVPLLFYGNKLLKRFRASGLLILSVSTTALRLLLLASTSNPNLVLGYQLLGGLTFPVLWIAGVSFADEYAPPGMKATAQGIFNAVVIGFGLAAGGFLGGILLENLGGRGLNLVFGLIVLGMASVFGVLLARSSRAGANIEPGPHAEPEM
jgi:MFS transporter, PPP family, 3-phenylpropionic acid transporter